MKIIKYTKLKNNQYQVDFDKESLILYDDIIIQYELLLKKYIKEDEFLKLKEENSSLKGYYLALKYLNYKMRTKKEIKDYLKKKGISDVSIEESIEKLEKQDYINDDKYTKFYINDSVKFSLNGPNLILQKLKEIGIKKETILQYLDKIPAEIWQEKIEKLIAKKVASNHSYSKRNLKNKLILFLQTKGYSKEMVWDNIENIQMPNDPSIIKKEKEKLERKLSRKYDGASLSYQVKMKLLQKGFASDEIEEILK